MNLRPADESEIGLWELANRARDNAYAPYSKFHVGAAILTTTGDIITGVNVENAAYSPTICAERAALSTAATMGALDWRAIAVAAEGQTVAPCGVCRQSLWEIGGGNLDVVMRHRGEIVVVKLSELLPLAFDEGALPPA